MGADDFYPEELPVRRVFVGRVVEVGGLHGRRRTDGDGRRYGRFDGPSGSLCLAASAADNAVALETADLGGRHAQQLREYGFCVLAESRRAANGDARDG